MSLRQAALEFGLKKSTIGYWLERARGQRVDRADLSNRKPGRAWNRTSPHAERRIVQVRRELGESVLGERGAKAIHRVLKSDVPEPPSVATINRVLSRLGMQDSARRVRRPAPPAGWYLPAVMIRRAELDSFDFIEDLKIADGPLVDVLTAKSLHGAVTDAWVMGKKSAKETVFRLLERWNRTGLPAFAQFDNDTIFQGAHHFADTVGAVSRLCLQLRVVPVFVPPFEHGMQNAIESFNALWQAKVWHRHRVDTPLELQQLSNEYIAAHRARVAERTEAAPRRRRLPEDFRFDPYRELRGQMIFVRRTDERGRVHMLGRSFDVSSHWLHRLVRCEVDFDKHQIRCIALRRRVPQELSLVAIIEYTRAEKRFMGKGWSVQ